MSYFYETSDYSETARIIQAKKYITNILEYLSLLLFKSINKSTNQTMYLWNHYIYSLKIAYNSFSTNKYLSLLYS